MAKTTIEKGVPDSGILSSSLLSKAISSKQIEAKEIIVHEGLISIFEYMAEQEKAIGFIGLDELKSLRAVLGNSLKFKGRRLSSGELRHIELHEADILSRELAFDEGASLITTSKARGKAAEAMGIKPIVLERSESHAKAKIEEFFDEETMSVHLKEKVAPFAKRGKPGAWEFTRLDEKLMSQEEIKEISQEIIESPKRMTDSFIEIERPGSTIVQMGRFRTVITRPPFSDGWEITASRPIKKLDLNDYEMNGELLQRISREASGLLIAGAPGSGKTTFASSLAEYYAAKNKIVKTIEAPRDMLLSESITQYAISHGNASEIHDILLLSRPDFSIFDEMRNTSDFGLYIDLRLAGIGLAGVVHATRPIDAIQRFTTRAELGVIPQVIDTVIFIEAGRISKALSINMAVKVPSGMTEADLARPIVEIRDFATKQLEYEMYSYGEETVIVPVISGGKKTPVKTLATRQIEKAFMKYTNSVEAEMVSDHKAVVSVPERDLAKIIGKKGENISSIEKQLGISIQLQPITSNRPQQAVQFEAKDRGNYIIFNTQLSGATVDVFVNDEFLFTSTVSKKGEIKVNKKSQLGKTLVNALDLNRGIEMRSSA